MATESIETAVLIAGGGPVGLALALDLGWRGVPCLLVEQGDGAIENPRMDLVGVRTMEFCRRWGIIGEVEEAGYPRDYPQSFAYVTSVSGYELSRDTRPSMAREALPAFSPQKRERCPQNFFDPVLRRAAESHASVATRFGWRLATFEQDASGVRALIERGRSGQRAEVLAQYLVGCDGAGSFVRRRLPIEAEIDDVLTISLNILFRYPGMAALSGRPPVYRYVLIDEGGLWATMVAIDGRDVWRLQVVASPDPAALTDAVVRQYVRRALGRDVEVKILSVQPWHRREQVAKQYRKGRVLLAGDAAHQMSPTGGFGMNTGIGDAVDLGWKLAAVLAGWGGERLLDSYDAERRPVAVRNSREASGNFRRMSALRGDADLLLPSAAGEAARKLAGETVARVMAREWGAVGIHMGYLYDGSPLCWDDGSPAPPDEPASYTQTARPGARAPHAWIAPGRSTLDLFGHGFVLLRLGQNAPDAAAAAASFEARGVPLEVVALPNPRLRDLYEQCLVVVRPDGHVAWRGDALPADPIAWVNRMRGA